MIVSDAEIGRGAKILGPSHPSSSDHHTSRRSRGLVSELELTATDDGVPTDCIVNFENIHTIRRDSFRRLVATLSPGRLAEASQRRFGNVWKWAGKRRTKATTIGVTPTQIVTQLKDTLDDVRYWRDHETFNPVETAVRVDHRLVFVHPDVNGNGRHARLVADLYLHIVDGSSLRWGPDESEASDSRAAYIAALRKADQGDYSQLIVYATGQLDTS